MRVTFTITNNNPNTIYNVLSTKLGREPTSAEIEADVKRIMREGREERA